MNEQEIKKNFSRNLMTLRKARGLTQAGLADKLNYSDKSVSKWERGDVLPDIVTFRMIADFFGVSVDELMGSRTPDKAIRTGNRIIITIISCMGAVLLSLITERMLAVFATEEKAWIAYIYALPVIGIICVVFTSTWFGLRSREISVSALVWFVGLSLYLTVLLFGGKNLWFMFIVCAIVQIIVILWFAIKKRQRIVGES